MGPSNCWLLWVRWVGTLLAIVAVLGLTVGGAWWLASAGVVSSVLLALDYKPLKQRVTFTDRGIHLSATLYITIFGRAHMIVRQGSASEHVLLGKCQNTTNWFQCAVHVGNGPRNLLIYFRYPIGFVLSQTENDVPLHIEHSAFCL